MNWEALGQLAYETHIKLLRELQKEGPQFPIWEELSPRIKQTWVKTAFEVCDTYARAIIA